MSLLGQEQLLDHSAAKHALLPSLGLTSARNGEPSPQIAKRATGAVAMLPRQAEEMLGAQGFAPHVHKVAVPGAVPWVGASGGEPSKQVCPLKEPWRGGGSGGVVHLDLKVGERVKQGGVGHGDLV